MSNLSAYWAAFVGYLSTQWPIVVQAVSAIAQAVAAVIIVRLTRRLVTATDTYASLTRTSVDLSTKQYEDALLPMWHLALIPTGDGAVTLKVFNLSKVSARVTYLLLRVDTEDEEPNKFVLDVGMPSGWKEDAGNVAPFILQTLQPYCAAGEWNGVLRVEIAFHLGDSPVPIPSAPFRFRVTVHEGRVTSMTPKLPAIAAEARQEQQR
jgi:hypothetical protein